MPEPTIEELALDLASRKGPCQGNCRYSMGTVLVDGVEVLCINGKVSMNGRAQAPHDNFLFDPGGDLGLRQECRRNHHSSAGCDMGVKHRGWSHTDYIGYLPCECGDATNKDGRGYTVRLDWETWLAVAKAKGWVITVETDWSVSIYTGWPTDPDTWLADAEGDDLLALLKATKQAVEVKP